MAQLLNGQVPYWDTANNGWLGSFGAPDAAPADIYVATTGSDATGDGTIGNPYATVAKALSILPALITRVHTIHVADGTYAEAITIQGFVTTFGGQIVILGNTTTPTNVNFTVSAAVTFRNANFDPCIAATGPVNVMIQGIKAGATCSNGILALNGAYLVIDRCHAAGTFSSSGVQAQVNATVEFRGNCTISGWTARGIGGFFGAKLTTLQPRPTARVNSERIILHGRQRVRQHSIT